MNKIVKAKPFIKWVGGKAQLLPQLRKLCPKDYNAYFEPFLGGGALFFDMHPQIAYLNDISESLIGTYINIKKQPKKIIAELDILSKEYYSKTGIERENIYYSIREEYNMLPVNDIKKSAYLIFLNKTCFNGMYRENSKGFFNVPFGRYKNPKILDKENLLAVSQVLQKTELTSVDFEHFVKVAKPKDFIYFDPPYYPISKTSSFTSYSSNIFSEKEQLRLRKAFDKLARKNCFVMLSNSYTNFIRELYKDYNQIIVMANRAINCKGDSRGAIRELVVLNYQP